MSRYKVQQLIDAIKEDGIPWGKGSFFFEEKSADRQTSIDIITLRTEGKKIGAACLVGIAAINLGVHPSFDLPNLFDDDDYEDNISIDNLIEYNDDKAESWEDAAKFAIDYLEPYKHLEFEAIPYDYTGMIDKVSKQVIQVIEGQTSLFGPE